ncbi:MAG: transposase [Pseudonocardia sp.]|nr:transposase [Pseudonocardia sp.]
MLQEDTQVEEVIARVAALDIGKAELVCCARVPHEGKPGRRLQDVETYSTMTRSLLGMADHLRCLGVTRVVMEATSDYWKPVFYLLEAAGFETWLVNARDVKHLPGRPKTDKLDAVWLCKVAERQMLRPSFVPPPEIRRLRDVARYRVDLVEARTAEKQRAEKLLEDAQIKLSVVASDIFGVSGREMMAALVAGQHDPAVLARMARGRMRGKISALEEAFRGHFTGPHGFLLAKMLTGLRPSPTRGALVGLVSRAPVGRGETVTGGPVRCMNRIEAVGWPAGRPSDRSPAMTVARTVADVLTDHVVFEIECIDRMYLNVYVPGLQYAAGLVAYVHRQLDLPIASTAPLGKISDGFTAALHRFARDQRVPWVDS